MLAFQASPDTPDGTARSSALNAARQICYWSSLFMTMMDERNVCIPWLQCLHQHCNHQRLLHCPPHLLLDQCYLLCLQQHHPVNPDLPHHQMFQRHLYYKITFLILHLISSLQAQLKIIRLPSPFLCSLSRIPFHVLQLPPTLPAQCLHRSIHYHHSCPLHYLDNPQQCIHSVVNLLFPHLSVCNLSFLCILNLSQSPLRPYKLHHNFSNKFHHLQVSVSLLPRLPARQLSTVLYPLPVKILLLQSLVSYLFANHLRQVCLCHCLLQPLTSLHPDKVQCHHPALRGSCDSWHACQVWFSWTILYGLAKYLKNS